MPSLAVAALQSAFEKDPNALHALIVNRVPCNQALADDEFVVVGQPSVLENNNTLFQVGALGLVNAVLAAYHLPLVAIAFDDERDENGRHKVVGFCEYTPCDKE